MTDDELIELALLCAPEDVDELVHALRSVATDVEMSERRNLDAHTSAWAVIATTAIVNLPRTLEALRTFFSPRRVSYLKIGDIEIHDPRDEDVDSLLQRQHEPDGDEE
jgi:hypothetical protein